MSTTQASNPTAAQNASKSSRRKKNKPESTNASQPEATPTDETKPASANGADGSSDSPYLRELNKNVRNIRKKLGSMQKVDAVIAENPDKSLDELLAARMINADQKAQAEKKPALKASLSQLEEQLEQFKKFEGESNKRLAAEKASLEASHKEELSKAIESARSETKAEAAKENRSKLLSLSRFLRTAAAKRQEGDETSEENRAFEGALLLIYGGDASAVDAMEKLIEGVEDIVPTVEGQPSNFTYKHVRDASVEDAPAEPEYAAEEAWVESVAQAKDKTPSGGELAVPVGSDPTVMHAGLTEVDMDGDVKPNGENIATNETPTVPEATTIDAGVANAVGESNWDSKLSQSVTSGPDSWVEVPRDPAETDTGLTATTAANAGMQSWAEDVPAEAQTTAAVNDGFHEVHHNRGRGRGGQHGEYRGGNRGRGYRGEGGYRGRGQGYRGDRGDRGGEGGYRGRGRGGPRGPRGGRGESW